MKILRLTLRNLASLAGTQTVDFERDPLRSTGLFSISGPTGSGKSTLLDALCLALYEQTPRLQSASGAKLPDVGESELTQKDPANLLRRGEAEGFAEVAFVGVDGASYTARWSIRRARLRRDGSLQATEMVLYRGNIPAGAEGPIECGGKKSEVLPAIAAKIGLSFAQFTRAVLLAQNEFGVFLKAEDKERAAILQALTGTERFERISVAIFERHRTELAAVEAMRARIEGQPPLAPEARAQAEAARQATETAWQSARQKCAEREAQAAWYQRQKELAAALDQARASLGAAKAAHDAATPRRQELETAEEASRGARTLYDAERQASEQHATAAKAFAGALEAATRAQEMLAAAKQRHATANAKAAQAQQALADAAGPLQRARTLDGQLTPLLEQCAKARHECAAAKQARDQLAVRGAKIAGEIAEEEKRAAALAGRRITLAHLNPVLEEAAGWSERLTISTAAVKECERLAAELNANAAAEAAVAAKLAAARRLLDDRLAARRQAEAHRAATETHLKQFDAEAIAAQRRACEARSAALIEARGHLAARDGAAARLAAAQSALAQLNENAAGKTQRLAALLEKQLPLALAAWNATHDTLTLAEAAVAHATTTLREALRPGAPCPVCGSTEHPYAAHPPAPDAALEAVRAAEKQTRAEHERLREEKTRLETSIAAITAEARGKATELDSLTAELGRARARVAAALATAALADLPDADQPHAAAAALAQNEEARNALSAREAQYREATKAYEAAVKACEAAHAQADVAEKAHAELAKADVAAKSTSHAARQTLRRAEEARTAAEAATEPLFAVLPPDNRERFRRGAEGFIAAFSADMRDLRALNVEAIALAQRAGQLAIERDEVAKQAAAADSVLRQRQVEENAAAQAHQRVHAERATVLGGRPVGDVERELTSAATELRTAVEAATTELLDAEKRGAAATAAVTEAERTVANAALRRDDAARTVQAWLAAYANKTGRAIDHHQLAVLLGRPEHWLVTERAALGALGERVSTAEGAAAARLQALAEHQAAKPTSDDEPAVAAALASCRIAETEAQAQCVTAAAVINADDRRRTDHAQALLALEEQRKKAQPWASLNELIGSADGAKFRTIVQGRTLDLLLDYANHQLELLSGRYRLERLRPSLNLMVVDRDMADERRSVHSLSGGESFLVSLALALGLASLTSNRIRIESLFIDEGFGSLDPATLNTAMNALMHLEAQGRKVGVISHVTEMADAIPVQIRVVKGQAGSSRLVVPGAPCDGAGTTGSPDKLRDAQTGGDVAPAEVGAQILDLLQAAETKPAKPKRSRKKSTAEPPATPHVEESGLI